MRHTALHKKHNQIAQDSRRPHHSYHDNTWLMQSRSTSAADCIRRMLHLNVVTLKVFIQSSTTIRLKLSSWEQPAQSTSHPSRRWFVHPVSGNNIQPSSTQTKHASSLAEAPACRRSNGLVELPNLSSCEEDRTLGVPPVCRQASMDAWPLPRTKSANFAISWEGPLPQDPAPCRQWDGLQFRCHRNTRSLHAHLPGQRVPLMYSRLRCCENNCHGPRRPGPAQLVSKEWSSSASATAAWQRGSPPQENIGVRSGTH